MSKRHRDALAHLLYGVQSDGGFILLTGEVGTGKTTLCRCLLEQVPNDIQTAFVLNPRVTANELLATICDEFGIEYPLDASSKILVDNLNRFLLECHGDGKKAVLIIDEAQNLSRDLLEQLRLLTNLETSERKLLQIILLGQPELLDMLAEKNLRQLSQRITARFHLEALDSDETRDYVAHRMIIAGGDPGIFPTSALAKIYRGSQGIPRVINLICDRALLGAYAEDRSRVTPKIVTNAAMEVLGPQQDAGKFWPAYVAAALLLVVSGTWYFQDSSQQVIDTHQRPQAKPIAQTGRTPLVSEPLEMPVVSGHSSLNNAYHDLIALWGTSFEDRTTAACELTPAIGLMCFERTLTLEELVALNRPVIVELDRNYLTVSEINQDQVTLIAGETQVELTTDQFQEIYNPQVRLLWRTPPAYKAPLKIDDRGAAVDWLVVQLSMIEGDNPPLQTGFTYDEAVESRVRDFQASVGLPPDGVVDEMTWIHLNSVEAVGIPTLVDSALSGDSSPGGSAFGYSLPGKQG